MTDQQQALDPIRWMFAQLSPASQAQVRRRLAIKLGTKPPAATRRKVELNLLIKLLAAHEPRAGWSFRHVKRTDYDRARTAEDPSSGALVERYGSWVSACRHADSIANASSNPLTKHRRAASSKASRRYTERDATDAILECARELRKPPSSTAYRAWRVPAERRRRGSITYPCANVIVRLYRSRGGWLAALEDAGLATPPQDCVRAVGATKAETARIAEVLAAAGLLVNHASGLCRVEVRADLRETETAIRSSKVAVTATIWCPSSRRLVVVQ